MTKGRLDSPITRAVTNGVFRFRNGVQQLLITAHAVFERKCHLLPFVQLGVFPPQLGVLAIDREEACEPADSILDRGQRAAQTHSSAGAVQSERAPRAVSKIEACICRRRGADARAERIGSCFVPRPRAHFHPGPNIAALSPPSRFSADSYATK